MVTRCIPRGVAIPPEGGAGRPGDRRGPDDTTSQPGTETPLLSEPRRAHAHPETRGSVSVRDFGRQIGLVVQMSLLVAALQSARCNDRSSATRRDDQAQERHVGQVSPSFCMITVLSGSCACSSRISSLIFIGFGFGFSDSAGSKS